MEKLGDEPWIWLMPGGYLKYLKTSVVFDGFCGNPMIPMIPMMFFCDVFLWLPGGKAEANGANGANGASGQG